MAILSLVLVCRLNGPLALLNVKNGFYLLEGLYNMDILGMNFCLLCLIDISVIAIHVNGRFNWGLYFTCDMTRPQFRGSFQ